MEFKGMSDFAYKRVPYANVMAKYAATHHANQPKIVSRISILILL